MTDPLCTRAAFGPPSQTSPGALRPRWRLSGCSINIALLAACALNPVTHQATAQSPGGPRTAIGRRTTQRPPPAPLRPLPDPFHSLTTQTRLLIAGQFAREGRLDLAQLALSKVPSDARNWESDLLSTRAYGLDFTPIAQNPHLRGEVLSMDFSPDGNTLAVAGTHVQFYLLDARSGETRRFVPTEKMFTRAIRFNHDGTLLATAHDNGEAWLWNAALATLLRRLPKKPKQVRDVCFSPDGATLATAGLDGVVRVWNVTDGAELSHTGPHQFGAGAVEFSPDGKRLASMSLGGEVFLWNPATGEQMNVFTNPQTLKSASLDFSPDGHLLACGFLGRAVVLDADTFAPLHTLGDFATGESKVAFAVDGKSLFTARDQSVCRWELSTNRALSRKTGLMGSLYSFRLSPDGTRFALGGRGEVGVFSAGLGDAFLEVGPSELRPTCIGFASNGLHLLAGRYAGYDSWNLTGRSHESHDIPGERSLAFSNDGALLALADQRYNIIVRNRASGEIQVRLDGHRNNPVFAEFSRSDRLLATGGTDKSARLWDLTENRQYWVVDDLDAPVSALAISPGETQWAVAERGGSVNLFQIRNRTLISRIDLNATALDCAPRDLLAAAGRDHVIRVWEGRSGRLVGTMYGHDDRINALRFTQDGSRLVSASADGTVRLWDPQAGIELLRFDLPGRVLVALAFGPGDRQLAVADAEGTVALWDRQRIWSPSRNDWLSVSDLTARPLEG